MVGGFFLSPLEETSFMDGPITRGLVLHVVDIVVVDPWMSDPFSSDVIEPGSAEFGSKLT